MPKLPKKLESSTDLGESCLWWMHDGTTAANPQERMTIPNNKQNDHAIEHFIDTPHPDRPSNEELRALLKAAEKAGDGSQWIEGHYRVLRSVNGLVNDVIAVIAGNNNQRTEHNKAIAQYIAAASPAVIEPLLKELLELREVKA